jgi:hypothetical protein
MRGNALETTTCLLVGGAISAVLTVHGFAKIGYAIVRSCTIDVVDLVFGPPAIDQEPYKSMFKIFFSENGDFSISPWVWIPRSLSNLDMISHFGGLLPSQNSRIGIIGQHGTKNFERQGWFISERSRATFPRAELSASGGFALLTAWIRLKEFLALQAVSEHAAECAATGA